MVNLARVTIDWTGFIGAPGFTNLHFSAAAGETITQGVADAAAAKVHAWITSWLPSITSTATLTVNPTVPVIDYSNGEMVSFYSVAPGAGRPGTGTSTFAAPTGSCVNFYTPGIRNGRRIRGRAFMVPLSTVAFDATGNLDNTKLATWRTATATLIANTDAAKLAVWSRPSAPDATDGIAYDVNAYTIADKAAILTSRRD